MKQRGAHILWSVLAEQGVDTVFGYPGGAILPAYDALLEDQLVNRMFGMRLYELTDRPVRPFLAAQAQRSPIVRGYEAFVASATIAGQDPVETTRLLATEIERASLSRSNCTRWPFFLTTVSSRSCTRSKVVKREPHDGQ